VLQYHLEESPLSTTGLITVETQEEFDTLVYQITGIATSEIPEIESNVAMCTSHGLGCGIWGDSFRTLVMFGYNTLVILNVPAECHSTGKPFWYPRTESDPREYRMVNLNRFIYTACGLGWHVRQILSDPEVGAACKHMPNCQADRIRAERWNIVLPVGTKSIDLPEWRTCARRLSYNPVKRLYRLPNDELILVMDHSDGRLITCPEEVADGVIFNPVGYWDSKRDTTQQMVLAEAFPGYAKPTVERPNLRPLPPFPQLPQGIRSA